MKLIPLHGINGKGKFAKVDDEDYDYLMQWRWFGVYYKDSCNFYAIRNFNLGNGKWTNKNMHQLLIGKKEGFVIDHDDGDGLNNQKGNLQHITNSENLFKKRKYSNGSSVYKGVTIYDNRYKARIQVDKKAISLGSFPLTPEGEKLAALAYNDAALSYFGNFANINDIDNPTLGFKHEVKTVPKKEPRVRKIYNEDGTISVPLTHGKFAIIDKEDEWVTEFNWMYHKSDYAYRVLPRIKGQPRPYEYLHKIIIGAEKGTVVDHKDRNRLNNRRSNLRKCDHEDQNKANVKTKVNKKHSKHKGVHLHASTGKNYWIAAIRDKHLKIFPYTPEGEILAAKAYNEAAIKAYGEFAYLNEV